MHLFAGDAAKQTKFQSRPAKVSPKCFIFYSFGNFARWKSHKLRESRHKNITSHARFREEEIVIL